MKCERCLSPYGEVAKYRVCSEEIDLKVCRKCANEARAVGLVATRLKEPADRRPVNHKDAAGPGRPRSDNHSYLYL